MGDYNAKLGKATNAEERKWIGKHTFNKETADPWGKEDWIIDNRNRLIAFMAANECIAANTWYYKHEENLVTYRIRSEEEHPLKRPHYDQIDYVLVAARWRNSITNIETSMNIPFDTDHYPVITDIKTTLKAITQKRVPETHKWEVGETEEKRHTTKK